VAEGLDFVAVVFVVGFPLRPVLVLPFSGLIGIDLLSGAGGRPEDGDQRQQEPVRRRSSRFGLSTSRGHAFRLPKGFRGLKQVAVPN
jgi:hypothetical protein